MAKKICPRAVGCKKREYKVLKYSKPVCPSCNCELDHLNMYEKGEKKTMLVICDGEPIWEEIEFYPDSSVDFECPECNEILTHKSEDAIKILKGKKIKIKAR